MKNQRQIIKLFDDVFHQKSLRDERCMLFNGDGFMDLVVRVMQETNEQSLVSMGHYFESDGMPYPDPVMHFRINREKGLVTPLVYKNSVYLSKSPDGSPLPEKEQEEMREFLMLWLNNIIIQGYSLEKASPNWIRQEQEKEGEYRFDGRMIMTRGFLNLLSPFEIFTILLDLEAFILHKGKIDYLQVYQEEGSGEKIYCIDQLSIPMKESGDYSQSELKEYNYATFLLPSEY